MEQPWDVVIVGAGPAGLSAALVLGRSCRRVLLCDDGRPRNATARASHGFFTRDGESPSVLREFGRRQLAPYDVTFRGETVVEAQRRGDGFQIRLAEGDAARCRRLLLASGLVDRLPKLEGVQELYGRSVFHCPYCDGWEMRHRPLAALGRGNEGVELALGLKTWSEDVVLLTHGFSRISSEDQSRLAKARIPLRSEKIRRLEGVDGQLDRVVFRTGEPLARGALFFHTGTDQRSPLAAQLGCDFTRRGCVKTGKLEESSVPGVYVAGDSSRDVQFIAVAAAEGAKAALGIDRSLRDEDHRLQTEAEARLAQASPVLPSVEAPPP